MNGGQPGNGAFPVSYKLEWHGGVHLTAPTGSDGATLPVRAIADGTEEYVRQRTNADSHDAPLGYADGYTSDAVVVIRHDTEIGADTTGQVTQVSFYSVYMHLSSIHSTVRQGRAIYRKDEIGHAGHIYGKPNVIHFEICCDGANLGHLIGRATGKLSLTADGRTDALFGEMYFHLPAGTPVYASKPLPQFVQAMTHPATAPGRHGHGHAHPQAPDSQPTSLPVAYTTTSAFVVGMRYADGAPGDAVLTTYHLDGSIEGAHLTEPEAEYKLYTYAKAISEAYPATARPAISAVYELLRFGRVIGPDALTPADTPHWRQISYPGGHGWVNLNANNINKFSDADFPQWKGWTLIDDDGNGDSRCDSTMLRGTHLPPRRNNTATEQAARHRATQQSHRRKEAGTHRM